MTRHIVHKASFLGDFLNAMFLKDPYLEPVPGEGTADPSGGNERPLNVAESREVLSSESLTAEPHNEETPLASESKHPAPVSEPDAVNGNSVEAGVTPSPHSAPEVDVLGPLTEGQLRLAGKFLSRHVLHLRAGLDEDLLTHRYPASDLVAMRAAAFERAISVAKAYEAMAEVVKRNNEEQGFLLQVVAADIKMRFHSNFETLAVEAQFGARISDLAGHSSGDNPATELVSTLVHWTELTIGRIASLGFTPEESAVLQAAMDGKPYPYIAQELGMDIGTIWHTVESAFVRLGVSDTNGLKAALRLLCVRKAEETFDTVRGMLKRDVINSLTASEIAGAKEEATSSRRIAVDQQNHANIPH